ncbi:MAG: MBL fold metallo-hydrolase [Alphaproteobacteria bacterium]|nr:MBL fold metallo-hydrolase [Alphaproteobacteria bacterium]
MAKLKVLIVPVTPFQQNCSLVVDEDTKQAAVVDPGGDLERIREAIKQSGVMVERIILTHGHIDHAGGAAALAEVLQVPVEGPHIGDKSFLDNLPARGAAFGIFDARVVTPDRWLSEGDQVTVGGLTFSVIEAPGHSPGSVVLFNAENKFALMGDVLFQNSIGRTDLPGGNHDTLLNSIREKILPLGDDVSFLPGHGAASRIGIERLKNPFLQD